MHCVTFKHYWQTAFSILLQCTPAFWSSLLRSCSLRPQPGMNHCAVMEQAWSLKALHVIKCLHSHLMNSLRKSLSQIPALFVASSFASMSAVSWDGRWRGGVAWMIGLLSGDRDNCDKLELKTNCCCDIPHIVEAVRWACETCITFGGTLSPETTNIVRNGVEWWFKPLTTVVIAFGSSPFSDLTCC